ncbi:MAG: GlmU family protein [Bacteroidota bacterium]|jgi:UDP-N-acetylglucosamine diphosphorylase/glucosamine-1-phosphate N-acetyltransferase
MNFILFDDYSWKNLLPFTFTRPVSEIRIGILTIHEKWEIFLDGKASWYTQNYLSQKYPLIFYGTPNLWINGKVIPNKNLCDKITSLNKGQALVGNNTLIAFNSGKELKFPEKIDLERLASRFEIIECNSTFALIENPWDIFTLNDKAIREDFQILTENKKSQPISGTNKFAGIENIFIEKGAKVECSVLNASDGPIYIGKNAEIMEGCLIRGPFALGEGAVLKMGTKVYGATTIGPGCKVGGEVNNSVFFANSNKAHDGFIGNSVIGEWCNLGADTNNSNLKNNYSNVKIWSHATEEMVDTGLQFCGLFMGDHSKCGINTMFNTGTVVGVSSNIYGGDFPIKFIPSFTWGGPEEFMDYRLEKSIEVAERVMLRRNLKMGKINKNIFNHIFQLTKNKK